MKAAIFILFISLTAVINSAILPKEEKEDVAIDEVKDNNGHMQGGGNVALSRQKRSISDSSGSYSTKEDLTLQNNFKGAMGRSSRRSAKSMFKMGRYFDDGFPVYG